MDTSNNSKMSYFTSDLTDNLSQLHLTSVETLGLKNKHHRHDSRTSLSQPEKNSYCSTLSASVPYRPTQFQSPFIEDPIVPRRCSNLHLNYCTQSEELDLDKLPYSESSSSNTYKFRLEPSNYLKDNRSKYLEEDNMLQSSYFGYPHDGSVRFSDPSLLYDYSTDVNYLHESQDRPNQFCYEDKSPGIAFNSDSNLWNRHNFSRQHINGPEDWLDQPSRTDCSSYTYTGHPIKEIVEVLGPEEVRWFYKYEADKKWTSFIGYDSLRIEWAYRDMLQKKSMFANDSFSEASQSERPVVCGGLYEVDVSLKKGLSIYWKADEFMIMRGTWFYDGSWIPLEENLSERLEIDHLTQFLGHQLIENQRKEVTHEVIHSLTLIEGQVDWFSPSEVFFSHDATPSRLMRSFSKKLGFQKTGYRIHRGYCLDASSADKPPDITHIVFVIHGIGQKMETGRIIKNCTSLRENIKWLKEKQFPESEFSTQNVEFFPVEWRSSLTLDAGIIDSITPHKIIGLRQMLNASFMDIMYYNSPQYREEIVTGLATELDRLYTMFTARNPYFEANGGKVSVIAHSLGCTITYDIVTGWSPAPQMSQSFLHALIELTKNKSYQDGERTLYTFQSALQHVLEQQLAKTTQPRLKFKIENFFCLGSPLAVFLALRWKRHENTLPQFNPQNSFVRMYNIFHPADPVAYRVEPLVCPKFSKVAPVTIQAYTVTYKTPYDEMPLEPLNLSPRNLGKENGSSKGESLYDQSDGELPTITSLPTTPIKGGSSWNFWNFMKTSKKGSDATQSSKSVDEAPGVLKHRIDFVLREGSMESSYLSALTSHTSYWGNVDVAYFLLCTLCPQYLDGQREVIPKNS